MAYTLVSSVGTGMYKEGYRKTVYCFPSGEKIETHIFLNALLKNKYRDISKIILVGTVTSGWDMLMDVDDELWEKVCEAKEKNAIDQGIISEIESYLSNKFNSPTVIKYHTDKIVNETSIEDRNYWIQREAIKKTKKQKKENKKNVGKKYRYYAFA